MVLCAQVSYRELGITGCGFGLLVPSPREVASWPNQSWLTRTIFPLFLSAACAYFDFWLVYWILRLWWGRAISFVLVLRHSVKRWVDNWTRWAFPFSPGLSLHFALPDEKGLSAFSLWRPIYLANEQNKWMIITRLEVHSLPKKAKWFRYWT